MMNKTDNDSIYAKYDSDLSSLNNLNVKIDNLILNAPNIGGFDNSLNIAIIESRSQGEFIHDDTLSRVCRGKNLSELEKFIDVLDDINIQDRNGKTLLIRAISNSFLKGVDLLLENKDLDVNITDNSGANALIYSAQNPCIKHFELIAKNTLDLDHKDKNSKTSLMYAISNRFLQGVDFLLKNAVNVDVTDSIGANALMYSVFAASVEHFKEIVRQTKDINYQMDLINGISVIHALAIRFTTPINKDANTGKILGIGCSFNPATGKSQNVSITNAAWDFIEQQFMIWEVDGLKYIISGTTIDSKIDFPPSYVKSNIHKIFFDLIDHMISRGADLLQTDMDGNTIIDYLRSQQANNLMEMLIKRYNIPFDSKITKAPVFGYKYWKIMIGCILATKPATKLSNVSDTNSIHMIHKASYHGYTDIVKIFVKHDNSFVNLKWKTCGSTPLLLAAQEGHQNIVEYLVEQGADINAQNDAGASVLVKAVYNNHPSIVEYLLKQEADPKICDKQGNSAIHHAVYWKYIDIVRILIKHDQSLLEQTSEQYQLTPLFIAAQKGYKSIVEYLVEQGADIKAQNDTGISVLVRAVRQNNTVIVEYLLNKGADPKICDKQGNSAIHHAIYRKHIDIVKILIEHDKLLLEQVSEQDQLTPLFMAAHQGHENIVKYLVEQGADIKAQNDTGISVLVRAVRQNNTVIVEYLLNKGADPKICDKQGNSAIHHAIYRKHIDIVKILIEHDKLLLEQVSEQNQLTPLLLAAQEGHKNIVEYLVEQGADIEAKNNIGTSVLVKAIQHHHTAIVEYLLQKGANPKALDKQGASAIHCAVFLGYIDIVKILIDYDKSLLEQISEQNQFTPLFIAAQEGHKNIVEYLVEQGADINAQNDAGASVLVKAVRNNHPSIVEYLLKQEADPKICDKQGNSAIHCAVFLGYIDIVRILTKHDQSLLEQTSEQYQFTPLFIAAQEGHKNIVEYLVEQGADINAQNDAGASVLVKAIQHHHTAIVEYLLKQEADPKICDKQGASAIHYAVYWKYIDIVRILIKHDQSLLEQTSEQNQFTPLSLAVQQGHKNIVKYLVEQGVDIKAQSNGAHVLLIAVQTNHSAIVEYLLNKGADVNNFDKSDGSSILQGACRGGHIRMVKFLLDNGANLDHVNYSGDSALHFTLKSEKLLVQQKEEIVKYLLLRGITHDIVNKDGLTFMDMVHGMEDHQELKNELSDYISGDISPNIIQDFESSIIGDL